MYRSGLNKLFWGFVFILINIKFQGFDIFPDIVGYLFFASGFTELSSNSKHFSIASKYNIPMIILSIFSIYQQPVQGGGIHLGYLGIFSIPIAIAALIINLLVVYNLFMGIKDIAKERGQFDLVDDADKIWNQFIMLQIALLFSFVIIFVPPLAVVYIIVLFIISSIITIIILMFLSRCRNSL